MPNGKIGRFEVPAGLSPEEAQNLISQQLGETPQESTQPAEPSGFMRRLGDVGLSTAQGIVGAGEGLLGLADIPTMGHAGRGAEIAEKAVFGGTSKDLREYLETLKSPEAKLAQEKVSAAKGFFPTAGAMLESPSTIVGSIAESVPSMIGGAGIARAALKEIPSLAGKTLVAGAAGEGAMSAGSTAESIRQQEESGLITPGQGAISGVSGVLTGGLGIFGGKVANYFKVGDVDQLLAGGINDFTKNVDKQSIVKAAVKGAISESLFEELPQSMQETIAQNVATGKPWDQGVAEAGAMGVMSALVMGGGAAGASQIAANAQIKQQQLDKRLADTQVETKADKSFLDEQDADDEAAAQPPVDTSFNTPAEGQPAQPLTPQQAEDKREADSPYGDTMLDEKTGFPLFAPRAEEAGQDWATLVQDDTYLKDNDLSTEVARRYAVRTLVGKINKISKNVATDDSDIAYARSKGKNELADTLELQYAPEKERLAKEQAKLAALQQYLGPTELEYLEKTKTEILGTSGFPLFAPPSMPAAEDVQQEFKIASQKVNDAIANKDEAAYEKALEELKIAREKAQTIQPGFQAPLFAQQQGLDFNQEMPVAPEGQAATTAAPKIGQQGLDFTQEQQGEYVAPKVEAPKFGFTTETSAAPLQQFLSRFKPRSTSEAEREKQQAALFGKQEADGSRIGGLLDQIAELYVDDSSEQQLAYSKGVIDSFFDKYAATDRPSKQAALENINNLSAEDQNRVLKDYTRLPDLTTYEGVKKLSDAFQDHVAEAELAGLGITKSSSAYKQADEAVRSLRVKPKAQYDEKETAAYDYFSNYGLDLALRSAAFDISVNTPRNQLYRGQGKDSALRFQEWLSNNAPESAKKFDKYLRAYKKQYEGYKAFQEIQTTKESEAETVADYVAGESGPKRSGEVKRALPVHPLVVKHIRNNNLQKALMVIEATAQGPFQRRLANRLAQLNLTTSIGVDQIDVLAEDYTDQTRKLLGKIAGMADVLMPDEFTSDKSTSRDMVLEIWDTPNQDMQARFKMAEAVVQTVKRVLKENKVDSSAVDDAIKDAENLINGVLEAYPAAGVYFPMSDSISLDSKTGLNVPVILHEVMHAGTSHIVKNPTMYSSKQQAAVKELEHLFEIAKLRAGDTKYYGLTNLDEFIAEAFTDRKFQEFLKGIKYKQSNMSLWDKFVQYCLEMFGYDNVLTSTMANVNVLFDAPDNGATYATPPPLFAKRNVGMFESNSAERSKPFAILTDLVKNTKTFSDIKANLAEALTTMNTQTRKTWLGALTLRQMNEMLGSEFGSDETGKFGYLSKLPQISRYLRKIEKMSAERSKVLELHTTIARKLDLLQRKNKPTIDKLDEVIKFATVNEVDPADGPPKPVDPNAPTAQEQKQIDAYPTAKLLWDNLGGMKDGVQAQKLYVEMRDFFSSRLKEFKEVAYEREFNRQLAEGISKSKKAGETVKEDDIRAKAKADIDKRFSEKITPYFPLKRFGRFWVRVGSGDNKIYMQFEDAKAQSVYIKKERTKLAANLKRQGATDTQIESALQGNKYINVGNNLPDLANDLFSSRKVFDEVKNIVDTGGKDITDVEELRKLMVDQLGELYTTTLPLQSIQRMFMHRQNISGASADLIRSFQHAAMHMAYQHARFKYAPELDMELSAAKNTVDSLKQTNVDDGAILQDYLDAINLKHKENVITPADSPRWLNVASNFNFLWFLTAPASAIVNMLAVPSIALPVMSGKYGTTKSAKTLAKYVKMLPSAGWKTLDTGEFDTPSIVRSPKLTAIQKKAYESASAGLFEQSLAHDAANFSENPSLDYSGRWGRIMEIATFPFHKAERFNREVTYMAAFELAYEKNGGNFDAAVNEASDLTYKTMFDYATFNKPRLMQGNISKLLLAFKQYPQHFTYLLMRTGFEATQKVSEEEKKNLRAAYKGRGEEAVNKYIEDTNAMRAEARKAFMMMMGMTFLFAGAAGLPMWWMYEGMANAFNAVFGDDEVPFDVNNDFKNRMNETFGGFVGDSISRGVIPQLSGLALSDRMSTNLTDMWFRDVKKNQDEVDYAENMIISLLGPTVGIGMKIPEAIKRFNDGHVERAAEALAPAAFKNVLAASRLAKEGALTMKGDTLIEDISGPEAFKQMLGFTPERLAQRQSANIEAKSSEQAVLQRRQDLLNALAMAMDADDEALEDKVWAKIDKFNEANDWIPISYKTVKQSMKKRAKAREMANELGGLNINKNFRDIAEEQTGYAKEEDEE
jgi:hypothetical protein